MNKIVVTVLIHLHNLRSGTTQWFVAEDRKIWSLAEMKAGNIPNVASYFRVFCIHTDCMPSYVDTVNPLLSPPGGLFFPSTFEWGLNREEGLKKEGGLI